MSASPNWRRVRRDHRCPICDRPDWCLVTADGSAAICARVESAKRCGEAGWLHRLRDSDFYRPARRIVRSIRLTTAGPRPDLAQLAVAYQRAVDPGQLDSLATSLGLTPDSLVTLGIGWSAEHSAWAFPMRDADHRVLGIRLRRANGFKFAVTGSKEGLFLPAGTEPNSSPLLVCEGPTDAAALLEMRFANVVGRPSCTGGIRLLVDLVRKWRPPEVVVVSDGDEPGRRGADNLASVLLAYVSTVRVIAPPVGIKDARDWLRAGATREAVEEAIAAAPARRLTVRVVAVQRG
jgi:hypothetical protein